MAAFRARRFVWLAISVEGFHGGFEFGGGRQRRRVVFHLPLAERAELFVESVDLTGHVGDGLGGREDDSQAVSSRRCCSVQSARPISPFNHPGNRSEGGMAD